MRKKSLRAMTSAVFEAPESRAEAIMQNILGANNVLVPPEAPFEEILQAILYNTPYTKEAEARIEEILLAIKNNGTYDEEPQSRDEEILISKLNETAYTKDAESRIEELFILWAAQSVIKQLEGVPPLAFTAQGQPLINWIINGARGGVGDKTANLCSVATWSNSTTDTRSYFQAEFQFLNGSTLVATSIKAVQSVGRYSLTTTTTSAFNRLRVKHNGSTTDIIIYQQTGDWSSGATFTISFDVTGYNPTVAGGISLSNIMLNTGSTALPYEPYGQYKIPILCGGETNTIYFDTPLYDSDFISMADTGIEIPTINGQNTLAVDTTVQPEKVYIEYK